MKIGIVGGGPAGLFFAYLMRRHDPVAHVRVVERNAADATYGWGVVFSDVALAFVRDIAHDHGGRVEVDSSAGETEFRIIVPAAGPGAA